MIITLLYRKFWQQIHRCLQIIIKYIQPITGINNHQSEVTAPPSALAAEVETSANNNAENLQMSNNHDHHSSEVEPASIARFPPVDDNPFFDADELDEKGAMVQLT